MATLTHSIDVQSDGSLKITVPPVIHKWRRFRHSYEVASWRAARIPYVKHDDDKPDYSPYPGGMPRGWNPLYFPGVPKKGYPDVVTLSGDFQPFTRAWQEYHFWLMKLSTNGSMTEAQLKAAFIPLFDSGRFLNNGYGVDKYHDYINKRNTAAKDPKFEALGMGGNIVKELGRVSYQGEWWVEIETLTGVPAATVTHATHPHLIFHAVNELQINGVNTTSEFPQLNGAPVWFAFAHKSGVQRVRESWLVEA